MLSKVCESATHINNLFKNVFNLYNSTRNYLRLFIDILFYKRSNPELRYRNNRMRSYIDFLKSTPTSKSLSNWGDLQCSGIESSLNDYIIIIFTSPVMLIVDCVDLQILIYLRIWTSVWRPFYLNDPCHIVNIAVACVMLFFFCTHKVEILEVQNLQGILINFLGFPCSYFF